MEETQKEGEKTKEETNKILCGKSMKNVVLKILTPVATSNLAEAVWG